MYRSSILLVLSVVSFFAIVSPVFGYNGSSFGICMSSVSIPEPSTVAILALGGLVLLRVKKKTKA